MSVDDGCVTPVAVPEEGVRKHWSGKIERREGKCEWVKNTVKWSQKFNEIRTGEATFRGGPYYSRRKVGFRRSDKR